MEFAPSGFRVHARYAAGVGRQPDPAQGRPSASGTPRRTVYGYVDRVALPDMYQVFDFANPDMSTAERETIVPCCCS